MNADGCVQSAKVLRSRHPLLDKAAEEALMQWQYTPLVLNGIAGQLTISGGTGLNTMSVDDTGSATAKT